MYWDGQTLPYSQMRLHLNTGPRIIWVGRWKPYSRYDDRLFVGTQNSMEVFGLANPESPNHVGSFWHATSCDPVYPVDDVAYVTLRTGDFSNCPGDINALVVLDITNVSNPREEQEITMKSPLWDDHDRDRSLCGRRR